MATDGGETTMRATMTAGLAAIVTLAGLTTGAPTATAGERQGASTPRLIEAQWRGDRGRRHDRDGRRWPGRRDRDNEGEVAAVAVAAGVLGLVVGSAIADREERRAAESGAWGEPSPYADLEEQRQDDCRAAYGPAYDAADGDCGVEPYDGDWGDKPPY